MMEKLRKAVGLLLKPLISSPLYFSAITICVAASPIVFSAVTHGRILHLILFGILQGIFLGYTLSLFSLLIKNRCLRLAFKSITGVLFACWTIAEAGSIVTTGTMLNADAALLVAETNHAEASGFLSSYLSFGKLMQVVLIAALISLTCVAVSKIVPPLFRNALISFTLAACVFAGAIGGACHTLYLSGFIKARTLQQLYEWDSPEMNNNPELTRGRQIAYSNMILRIGYICKSLNLQTYDMYRWEDFQREVWHESYAANRDSVAPFDVVIVIGESFVRAHSQLYGYYLPTNPRLKAEADSGRLAVYSDVISPANYTTISLRNIMNTNSICHASAAGNNRGRQWYESAYLPLLMKKAGWQIYHYDNQTVSGRSDTGISRMFYSPTVSRHVLDGVSDTLFAHDGPYVDYVHSTLARKENPGKKLVIYHLMGQHFEFRDRYEGTPHFTPHDIKTNQPWIDDKARQIIADYNNATLYNDSVVGKIIDRFRQTDAVAIYFSDHGEDSWELAPAKARNLPMPDDPSWLDRQFHVPFMVWMSDDFMSLHPTLAQKVKDATDRKWSLDNLPQLVMGMCGVECEFYDPKFDIISPEYRPYLRTTASGYEYDRTIDN